MFFLSLSLLFLISSHTLGSGDPRSSDGAEKDDGTEEVVTTSTNLMRSCQYVLIAVATIGIFVGASVSGIASLNGAGVASSRDSESINNTDDQQRLLEIAEEVVSACSEDKLNRDLSECQQLCRERTCCFEEEEEYSCEDDGDKDCPVYAGCQALIAFEGDLVNAATTTGSS
mmetsp:Transcript_23728/g.49662  ORF Transcript_23728/g.49662 Transcript_23728/m.49662 type:complete len:172 (-) Transcript_23728:465-980(-)